MSAGISSLALIASDIAAQLAVSEMSDTSAPFPVPAESRTAFTMIAVCTIHRNCSCLVTTPLFPVSDAMSLHRTHRAEKPPFVPRGGL